MAIRFAKGLVSGLVLFLFSTALALAQHMRVEAAARGPDGRIIVAGASSDPSSDRSILVGRLNADGTVDATFGSAGWASVSSVQAQSEFRATGVAVQADGKIIVAAQRDGLVALARLQPDGTSDFSFGSQMPGLTIDYSTSGSSVHAVLISPTGALYTVGTYDDPNGRVGQVLQYDSSGYRNSSFGIGGDARFAGNWGSVGVNAAVLTSQGDIIAAGSVPGGSGRAAAAFKLNAAGQADPTFGYGGMAPVDPSPGDDEAFAVIVDSAGRIVLAGRDGMAMGGAPQRNMLLARFNANGTLDSSFAYQGWTLKSIQMPSGAGDFVALSVYQTADGNLVAAGTATELSTGRAHFANWSVNDAGMDLLDPTVQPVAGDDNVATAVFGVPAGLLGNGEYGLVVGTQESISGTPDAALVMRYFNDGGELDTFAPSTAMDVSPNAFSLPTITRSALGVAWWSCIRVTGINAPVQVSIAGDGTYSTDTSRSCGGTQTVEPSTVIDGTYVNVYLTAATTPSTTKRADVTIGDATSSFIVTTGDPPNTLITSYPSATSTTAMFGYTSDPPGSYYTFQCSLDNAAFTSCPAGSVSYPGLAEGAHTFAVRAVSADMGPDPTPATYSWSIALAPTVFLTTWPNNPSAANVTFAFASNSKLSTFECAMDGAAYSACTSPASYTLTDGAHSFAVRAVNPSGTSTPAALNWTVDATPPDTTITGGPLDGSKTNQAAATFYFNSFDTQVTYQCQLDGAGFQSCASPQSYSGLADGSHTFQVRARDRVGNLDPTPATVTWTIDTTPVTVTITSGPDAVINATTASFQFSASKTGVTYRCSLNGGTSSICGSTTNYSSLADNTYLFKVTVTDAAGNSGSASRSFTVDTSPPHTSITSAPANPTRFTGASFSFTADDASATFECRVDASAYSACQSGVSYANLAEGSHTFQVRARDAAGNVETQPPSFTWTVDLTAPSVGVSGPFGAVATNAASIVLQASEPVAKFECSLNGGSFATCTSPVSYSVLPEGVNTFSARATDLAGNVSPVVTTSWIVDTTPPDTTITSGPNSIAAQSSATFTFQSTEAGSTFQCAVDGFGVTPCTSPVTYNGLPDGPHGFNVWATDAVGNVDPTPAQWAWTSDTVPPDTAITSGPNDGGVIVQHNTTVGFSASEAGSTFECSVDGAAFVGCSNPVNVTGLADGTHTFQVRAVDAAGNADPTPASTTFLVDTTADTTITDGPAPQSASTSATFTFTSEAGATFACRLDAGSYAACTSPTTYSGLAQGSHTFNVVAVDPYGNVDPTPATWTWNVDTVPPDTVITSGPSGNNNPSTATLSFASSEPNSTFQCKLDSGAYTACATPITYSNLPRGTHVFSVKATDAAGNTDATPATRSWNSK